MQRVVVRAKRSRMFGETHEATLVVQHCQIMGHGSISKKGLCISSSQHTSMILVKIVLTWHPTKCERVIAPRAPRRICQEMAIL